jgi:copper homeostasis protein
MTSSGILEVIVCSEPDAVAAVEGGADRLEIINHFEAGGLTPPLELVRRIAARVPVPLRVMLRHSEPFVVRDRGEIEDLCAAARAFASIGIDGLVLGFLQDSPGGQRIDHQLLTRVLACAPNVKATFHRAFEELNDPLGAIGELKRHSQVDRLLTSAGGDPLAIKLDGLTKWHRMASPQITLVLGGATDAYVIERVQPTGIREFHVGRAVRAGLTTEGPILVDRVRALAEMVKRQQLAEHHRDLSQKPQP